VCPKCGREGKAGVSVFRAKGKEYTYLVVNHSDGKKCVIARADSAVLQTAKPVLQSVKPEVEQLRRENAELKAEVARLKEENARLREAIATLREAVIAQAGPRERECLRLVAIQKKSGLPEEVKQPAQRILHALAGERSVDWVAV
jgi:predicted RNase H-like nuclease (RuvC/YqgF family)